MPDQSGPARVLILCTGNSARSQMAEGWLRHLGGDAYEVLSAGTSPAEAVKPLAIRAMAESGVDISGQYPKHVQQFVRDSFDYIITVCDNAKETCPFFPGGGERIHWSFDDPASAVGDEDARLDVFRRVRDEIRARLETFVRETVAKRRA